MIIYHAYNTKRGGRRMKDGESGGCKKREMERMSQLEI